MGVAHFFVVTLVSLAFVDLNQRLTIHLVTEVSAKEKTPLLRFVTVLRQREIYIKKKNEVLGNASCPCRFGEWGMYKRPPRKKLPCDFGTRKRRGREILFTRLPRLQRSDGRRRVCRRNEMRKDFVFREK